MTAFMEITALLVLRLVKKSSKLYAAFLNFAPSQHVKNVLLI